LSYYNSTGPETFALRLKSRGFVPGRQGGRPLRKPVLIDCRLYPHKYAAYLLPYDKETATEYVEAFKTAATMDGMSKYTIEDHSCLRRLSGDYPARAASIIKEGKARFVHYERIAVYHSYEQTQLIALSHVRYVLSATTNYSYYDIPEDPDDGFPHFQVQIIDSWFATESMPGADHALASAITCRALEHLQEADSALPDPDDTNPPDRAVYWFVTVETKREDKGPLPIAGIVSANLMSAACELFTDHIGLYNSDLLTSIVLKPISSDDMEDIHIALKRGTAVEDKPITPRAPVGELQHFLVVTDKSFTMADNRSLMRITEEMDVEPILWYLLVDDATRVFYVEPVCGETEDIEGFIARAWARKPNLIFEGKPKKVSIARRHMACLPNIEGILQQKGVQLVHPHSGFASCIKIGQLWVNEVEDFASYVKNTIPFGTLEKWSFEHQVVFAGNGWFNEHRYQARDLAWHAFGQPWADHWCHSTVSETKKFAIAVGRKDAEEVIKKNWPRQVSDK
jgi:hypothetical protein